MIALLESRTAGQYSKGSWLPNLVAGVVVGVVALPLAMAFAIASGARPEQGIYTAIVAGALVSALGGSRVQIAGPTGAFIAVLGGISATHGIVGLQIATLMAGVIMTLMGLLRMGGVIKFIPAPVIAGFTTGIGVIIFVGQWAYFFGLPATQGIHFHEKFIALVQVLPHLHPATLGLSLLSLALVLLVPKLPHMQRVPGPLVAMVVATVLQAIFQWGGVATIGSAFGGVPQGLPSLQWPSMTLAGLVPLLGPALSIALLGAIESLLSAVVADGMTELTHDSNQELIGQGIANIVAPLFGGFAATGAIARTATNIRNGGTNPIAGITHSLTLMATLLFLAPLAGQIPLGALAAILFVVAYNMSDLQHFFHIARGPSRPDVLVLLLTFALTVLVDLVAAVLVGVVLALVLRRWAKA